MNKISNILFRADSSSTIGTGHIMRDLVLAKQYPKANIIFATQDLSGNINHKIIEAGYEIEILNSNDLQELDELIKKLSIDMIVIDHYEIDYKFEKQLSILNSQLSIMVLDDTYEKHHCNILLNHNIYANKKKYKGLVPKNCELKCGSNYTLLRDEFIKEKERKKQFNIQHSTFNILITMGGADYKNLNIKILKVLEDFENLKIIVVTTNSNKNLEQLKKYCKNKKWIDLHINSNEIATLMVQSNFAIITPSVTANEVYFMELPFMAIKVADNQKYMVEFLKDNDYTIFEEFDKHKIMIFCFNLLEEYNVKKISKSNN